MTSAGELKVEVRRWPGQWVADALDVSLVDEDPAPPRLIDLLGLALRHNPRRAHLLVSRVLGKHVPTDPRLVYGAGRLLGAHVGDVLTGAARPAATAAREQATGHLVAALRADPGDWVRGAGSAAALLRTCEDHAALTMAPPGTLVLGYAETATGLGQAVADALRADYLHSTRRVVAGDRPAAGFEEEHSHATSHSLLPTDPDLLARDAPLVLIDDELSTGQTVINTIRALNRLHRRERYVIAALVDLRSPADRERLDLVARELGVRIDTVALATGRLGAAPDSVERGRELASATRSNTAAPRSGPGVVHRYGRVAWPAPLIEGGRIGWPALRQAELEAATAALGRRLAESILATPWTAGARRRVLVLGLEEFLHAPTRTAAHLADVLAKLGHPTEVLFSSTTRSPVLAVDDAGYAIRSAITFAGHDEPAAEPGRRFAYNVVGGAAEPRFTDVVVIVDGTRYVEALERPDGLVPALADVVEHVHLIALSPLSPEPLRGPAFGSYPAADVAWLLTDLSAAELEAPTEEREEAIQSGGAHYAESLPTEYQPSEEYQALFRDALARSAARVAHAVGVVTELALAERGPDLVLASLARAGTPIGVVMRRWAQFAHGLDLSHYSLSIVRGRGIDTVALDHLTGHHRGRDVLFVDGWTGKGAIVRELIAAVEAYNAARPPDRALSADLAVLTDPGGCAQLFGSRADYLIPSACLNSTVSGLVSRTVLNERYLTPGEFHGAKFYSELAAGDVSMTFIEAVVGCFADVAAAVARDWPERARSDRAPTWAGWATVEQVSAAYGIRDLNLIKPGVGETTRVLLRRVPWRVLMRPDSAAELGHIRLLAEQRGVEIEYVEGLAFACIGLIHPEFTRAAVGADGHRARS